MEALGSVECVLEEILEFKREISIMYFKSTDIQMVFSQFQKIIMKMES